MKKSNNIREINKQINKNLIEFKYTLIKTSLFSSLLVKPNSALYHLIIKLGKYLDLGKLILLFKVKISNFITVINK